MVLSLDYNAGSRSIVLSGPELPKTLKGEGGTFFLIALGFRPTSRDEIRIDNADDVQQKLMEVIRHLRKSGLQVRLTPLAEKGLKERLEFLSTYESSIRVGNEISSSDSVLLNLAPDFIRELKPFQTKSVKHIVEIPYSANFSVPGSGKTTMVLAAYAILRERKEVTKLLVICPRAAFDPWEEEFEKCFGRSPIVARISGQPEVRRQLFEDSNRFEMMLCSYQMLANELIHVREFARSNSVMLVIDESHKIKKGPPGVWFNAVNEVARLARRKIVLSGTPAPNRIDDLVAQFEILWPGMKIVQMGPKQIQSDSVVSDVRSSIQPFYTRVRKADLGLPPRTVIKTRVKPGPVQQKIYQALTYRVLSEIAKGITERMLLRELRKALVVRLLQAASNPSLLGEYSVEFKMPPLPHIGVDLDRLILEYSKFEQPAKVVVAVDLAQKIISKGSKVIVWTSFIHNAHTLAMELESMGIECVCVTGLLPTDEDEENREFFIRRFKRDDKVKALVATIPSVGESISLHTVCGDAIYVDRTFNCGIFMQSMDRIHRIGLPNDAHIRYYELIAENTIDEVVDDRLDAKMEIMHRLLNDDIGILNLEMPEDLSEGDWDDADLNAVLEQIRARTRSAGNGS
jgi:SNF2 family DNA or RNA helicase